MVRSLCFVMLAVAACSPRPLVTDAGADDAGDVDASVGDDAGAVDAGLDAGSVDAGDVDSGIADAGGSDSGAPDSGTTDAGQGDSGTVDAGARPDAGPDGCFLGTGGTPFRLRAVAANLSSGNNQTYDPGNGLRILQGIHPDVVMIQEFNYGDNSETAVQQFVDAMSFDAGYTFTRGTIGNIPNGIISRWPILSRGDWTDPYVNNRSFVWSHIDLPGPRDLWAVSVHLLTTGGSSRTLEANSLLAELQQSVPAGDFLLIGGDFNTMTRGENCLSVLQPVASSDAPYPVDQLGNDNTSGPRTRPYDHVLGSRCISKYQVPVVAGSLRLDGGLVVDTRTYVPLTEISPALFGDSSSTNMQHMAVVKDFMIAP